MNRWSRTPVNQSIDQSSIINHSIKYVLLGTTFFVVKDSVARGPVARGPLGPVARGQR